MDELDITAIEKELSKREPDYTVPLFISPTDMQITGEKVLPIRPRARIVMIGCFNNDGIPFYWMFDSEHKPIPQIVEVDGKILLYGWSREELKKVYKTAKQIKENERDKNEELDMPGVQ